MTSQIRRGIRLYNQTIQKFKRFFVQKTYCLNKINKTRMKKGLKSLALDGQISADTPIHKSGKMTMAKPCIYCQKVLEKEEKKTNYFCSTCFDEAGELIALCKRNCFRLYHCSRDFRQTKVVQSNVIGIIEDENTLKSKMQPKEEENNSTQSQEFYSEFFKRFEEILANVKKITKAVKESEDKQLKHIIAKGLTAQIAGILNNPKINLDPENFFMKRDQYLDGKNPLLERLKKNNLVNPSQYGEKAISSPNQTSLDKKKETEAFLKMILSDRLIRVSQSEKKDCE